MSTLLLIPASAQDVLRERTPTTVSVSWAPVPANQPCRFKPLTQADLKYIELRLDQIVFQQFVTGNGATAWTCVVPVSAPDTVIRQGGSDFRLERYFSWAGTSLFAEFVNPTRTRVFRVAGGHASYADIDGPFASQDADLSFTPAKDGGQETGNIVFDQSGKSGGIYVLPVADTTELTQWPDADYVELDNGKLVGRRICDGRKLWGKDNVAAGSDVTGPFARCEIVRHDTWTEVFLKPDKPTKGGILFVHGGPGMGEFTFQTRQFLLEYAYAGYEVDAVDYLDQYPFPQGRAAGVQIEKAQHQLLEAWQALRARTGTPPTILAESFGFLMLDEILKQPEPLSIIAMSPAVSGEQFISFERRRGLASGLPDAGWQGHASLILQTPDIKSRLCRREAPTNLHVFDAKEDAIFLAGGPAFLNEMKSCPRISLTHTETAAGDHASDVLYAGLLTVLGEKKNFTLGDNLDYERTASH